MRFESDLEKAKKKMSWSLSTSWYVCDATCRGRYIWFGSGRDLIVTRNNPLLWLNHISLLHAQDRVSQSCAVFGDYHDLGSSIVQILESVCVSTWTIDDQFWREMGSFERLHPTEELWFPAHWSETGWLVWQLCWRCARDSLGQIFRIPPRRNFTGDWPLQFVPTHFSDQNFIRQNNGVLLGPCENLPITTKPQPIN